ncbi:hypothetical protein, partial [Cronobacter dublinensis]|uniref:hypothetical protein n=1 Tax=Cronobacter dublinensis TaxID=413497 RepID=UPI001F1A9EFF
FGLSENTDDMFFGKTLLHGDVLMWLMKTLLTSRCINQRGAGHYANVSDFRTVRNDTTSGCRMARRPPVPKSRRNTGDFFSQYEAQPNLFDTNVPRASGETLLKKA